jgi:serine/threonine protein kinase/tetratricopeptide (TPR) repeat protein
MPGRRSTPNLLDRCLGHYRVLGRLGKGGMGEVYEAEDQRLHRRVALKVLRPDLTADPRHLERFQREARAIASLNHPNIVTLHAVEEAEGRHFLVLERVEGETLAELLADGPMPLDQVLAIALPLTEALEAAHARGIVHRDLKPGNIMVSREGRVKILDFGIARLARADDDSRAGQESTTEAEDLTRSGGVVGTRAYMSPEQIQDRQVDPRSDLFSLGIVLYEMATGQRPFRGKGALSILASILHDTPPPPSSLAPGLPDRFDEIVSLCLTKEPFLRYRGSAELREDLLSLRGAEAALDTTSVHLHRPRAADSSSSTTRRGTHSRLPARPRCFGREAEVRELVEALCGDPPPPVPVLGPAGAGKSTITLAALHDRRVAERFGKRRWFVRCDGVTGRDSLVGAIARAMCSEAVPPLEPKILLDLEDAPAVLALDNFETPWERDPAAVEELLAELAGIPGLALVVALRGEQRPLGPSWREAIHAGPLDPVAARSAFLAVAGERYGEDPDLDPLLVALDGLALAVILLASQAEGEPDLSMLRRRWQRQRTALLRRAGGRDAQQSFETSLGLSIESPRMTDEGRRLLSILGLLPEGAAREDLEALLPGDGADAAAVLRKVGLVFDQGSRLRMLAPIREHLRRSLPPRPEDLDRAVSHYLGLARLGEKIGGEGGEEAARRLRSEVGNLEPMIQTALERSDPEPALQAALAFAEIIRSSGLGSLGVLESARQTARRAGWKELEASCIRKQGDIAHHRSRYSDAQALYRQALELYREIGDARGEGGCLARMAEAFTFRAELDEAERLFQEAYARFQSVADPPGEAQCLLGLGSIALFRSDMTTAQVRLQEARRLFHQTGDLRGEANCLLRLAQVSFNLQDFATTESRHKEALALFRQAGALLGEALSTVNLGSVTLHRGDAQAARTHLQRGLALNRRAGSLLGEANCLRLLGDTEVVLGNLERADLLFEQARTRFQRVGQAIGEAHCDEGLGDTALARRDFAMARVWFERALALFAALPDQISVGRLHLHLAKASDPGSRQRREHVEAAERAWEGAGVLEQRRHELEAVLAE